MKNFLKNIENRSPKLNQLDEEFNKVLQKEVHKIFNQLYAYKIKPLESFKETFDNDIIDMNNKLKKIEYLLNLKVFENSTKIKQSEEDFKLKIANILNLIQSLSMSMEKLENTDKNI
jgi:hypothetical protein